MLDIHDVYVCLFFQELERDLEQCFLCLYGHPSKKAKVKNMHSLLSNIIGSVARSSPVDF